MRVNDKLSECKVGIEDDCSDCDSVRRTDDGACCCDTVECSEVEMEMQGIWLGEVTATTSVDEVHNGKSVEWKHEAP